MVLLINGYDVEFFQCGIVDGWWVMVNVLYCLSQCWIGQICQIVGKFVGEDFGDVVGVVGVGDRSM